MQRKENWRVELQAFLEKAEFKPVEYGRNDCALFVADAVSSMFSGADIGASLRGTYSTPAGAAKAIIRLGFGDLDELMTACFTEIAPLYASTGDVATLRAEDGVAIGVVVGHEVASAYGRVPLNKVLKAFRV